MLETTRADRDANGFQEFHQESKQSPCALLNKMVKTLRLPTEIPPVYSVGFRQKGFPRLSDFPHFYVVQTQSSFAGGS